jgi:molybdopterin-guanine dinucleotide biosynthesis protein A
MGRDKAFAGLGGGTLMGAVIARVEHQVEPLALNVRLDQVTRCRQLFPTYPILPDLAEASGIGPLGGVLAGLQWAKRESAAALATFPVDTPYLPTTVVRQLLAAQETNPACPIVATDGERVHNLCALWPLACFDPLRDLVVAHGVRSVWQALDWFAAGHCVICAPAHAFLNVNTPDDLAKAADLAGKDEAS